LQTAPVLDIPIQRRNDKSSDASGEGTCEEIRPHKF